MEKLLWFVTGLWTCSLVTGGTPHVEQSLFDEHRTSWSDHVKAMEAQLQQQASEISRLNSDMSDQMAFFNSQMEQQAAFFVSQITALKASFRSQMEEQKVSFDSQVAALTTSFKSQLAALTSQMTSQQLLPDVHRAVRSDDVSPMEVELQQQASDITSLKARMTANDDRISTLQNQMTPVVFSGERSRSNPRNDGDIIFFDRVLANIGDIYDSLSGIVTVPQDGVYVISVRADPPGSQAADLALDLRVNNVHQVYAFGEHGTTGGVTVALTLRAGDRVHVVKASGTNAVEMSCILSIVRVSP